MDRPLVAVLVGLGLALRLPNLQESLWYDEVVKATHQISSTPQLLWRFVSTDYAAPLHPVLMFFWVEAFGEHELSLRLPSLLFGLASIALTYRIAKRFDAPAALAAGMLCFSPVHVWYSQEATHYTLYSFLILLSVCVWPRVVRSPYSRSAHLMHFLALLAASFTHYYAALFLIPFTLLSRRAEKRIRYAIWLEHALVGILLAAWLVGQYGRGGVVSGQPHLRPFTIFEWWMLFFHWYSHGNTLVSFSPYRANLPDLLTHPWLVVLQLGLAALLAVGLWRRQPGRGRAGGEIGLYLCVLPLALLVATAVGFPKMYVERYVIVGVPFFAIGLARGLGGFSRAGVRASLAVLVAAVSIASYVALLRSDAAWTVYKRRPDWRSVAEALEAEYASDPRLILMATTPLNDLDFYLRQRLGNLRPRIRPYTAQTLDRLSASRQTLRLVVVKNLVWPGRADTAIERCRKDPGLHPVSVRSFYLAELHTFAHVVDPP